MKKSLFGRLICLVLIAATLFVGGAVLSYHGEVWFPLLERMRIHEEIPWTAVNVSEGTECSVEQLKHSVKATFSDVWMLINSEHPLDENYEPLLVEYGGAKMNPHMVQPYVMMRDSVLEETGVRIYVVSDFRTSEEQDEIVQSSRDGVAAPTGCSEHEAGLALDVYAPYRDGMEFLRSDAGRAVNRVCGEYGFILRYPVGKEAVTGISYEPWHLRYVGAPHAKIIMDCGLAYEEYLSFFTPNQWYRYENYYVGRFSSETITMPSNWKSCEISPDNTGCYMITVGC